MSGHTPGPWSITRHYEIRSDETLMTVADVVKYESGVGRENARLISAAPDMLVALLLAERFIEDDTCRHDSEKEQILRAIGAAIIKARGDCVARAAISKAKGDP